MHCITSAVLGRIEDEGVCAAYGSSVTKEVIVLGMGIQGSRGRCRWTIGRWVKGWRCWGRSRSSDSGGDTSSR